MELSTVMCVRRLREDFVQHSNAVRQRGRAGLKNEGRGDLMDLARADCCDLISSRPREDFLSVHLHAAP